MIKSQETTEIGCVLWENSFVKIYQHVISKSQTSYIFRAHSRQRNGYFSIGIFSQQHVFEDYIGVIGYLPNNVFQLKNHTEKVSQKTIFGETVQDEVFNSLDGTFTFAFLLNASDVETKNYIAFSQNFYETPTEKNTSISIPKHSSFSSFKYFQFNSTKYNIPICRFGLNISARISATHPAAYITTICFLIFVFLLYIQFHNDQPFKSRFVAPYFSFFANFVNFFTEELFSQLNYETSSHIYCIMTPFIGYASLQAASTLPVILLFRYMILLKIHNNKINLIKKLKKKASFHEEANEVKFNWWKVTTNYILKMISSPWIILIFPIIWIFVFWSFLLIIYGVFDFQCTTTSFGYMRLFHFGYFGINFAFMIGYSFYDVLSNIPSIIRCKWKNMFYQDDPFFYRLDMYSIWLIIPPSCIWGFATLPKYIYAIVTDWVILIGLWVSGWQMLVITIVKKMIFFRNNFRKSNGESGEQVIDIQYCIDPKMVDFFIRFCESEWSVENIYFKLDVKKYELLTSKSERKQFSEIIRQKYLIPGVSELEINCPNKYMYAVSRQIDEGNFPDDLFQAIECIVDINLSDTISRFQFSSTYTNYLTKQEKKNKELGL
eukprot:gene6515-10523_t